MVENAGRFSYYFLFWLWRAARAMTPINLNGCRVHVGVAGWSYDDWVGIVYAGEEKDRLRAVLPYLGCIEINSSFYRPIPKMHAERWVEAVENRSGFLFTAKLWQRFTHQWQEPYSREESDAFRLGIRPLHEAGLLGALLLQFPFYFRRSSDTLAALEEMCREFSEFPLVVEVRDKSWESPESFDFFRALKVSLASIDLPMTHSTFADMIPATGPIGYLRLHGRNYDTWFLKGAGRDDKYNYLYSREEMDELEKQARRLAQVSSILFVVFNNHFRGQAVANSLEMLYRLLGKPVAVPTLVLGQYPHLGAISEVRSSGSSKKGLFET